jgi:adenosylcobinamide-GDP ribazoletransferase
MMAGMANLSKKLLGLIAQIEHALIFSTRIRVRPFAEVSPIDVGRCLWALPLAGLVVGLFSGYVFWVSSLAGLGTIVSAAVATAAAVLVTGALHEDGLADTADGFGGGTTPARKLEIMRDSRIGTYGSCGLFFCLLVRTGAVAEIAVPKYALLSLIGAHAAARATMPVMLLLLAPARADGLAAGVARPSLRNALVASAIGAVVLFACFSAQRALLSILLLGLLIPCFAYFCRNQIGGHTGDTLGALEQISEIVVLSVAASHLLG